MVAIALMVLGALAFAAYVLSLKVYERKVDADRAMRLQVLMDQSHYVALQKNLESEAKTREEMGRKVDLMYANVAVRR